MGGRTLGQQLARTIAEGTSIDTTAGTKHTESVEPETFSGSIAPLAGDKNDGAESARKHIDRPSELCFWTDNSGLNSGHTGHSIEGHDPD